MFSHRNAIHRDNESANFSASSPPFASSRDIVPLSGKEFLNSIEKYKRKYKNCGHKDKDKINNIFTEKRCRLHIVLPYTLCLVETKASNE
jgi:hypothetical protein